MCSDDGGEHPTLNEGSRFFDNDQDRYEDPYSRGHHGGYRRGRGRRGRYTRGGYQETRGNRRGGGRGHFNQGKFEKNPNLHLQEKFKDDFFK